MFKKLVLAALLALQIGAVATSASAESPWPLCFPCPDGVRR